MRRSFLLLCIIALMSLTMQLKADTKEVKHCTSLSESGSDVTIIATIEQSLGIISVPSAMNCFWKLGPNGTKRYVCCFASPLGGMCFYAEPPPPPELP